MVLLQKLLQFLWVFLGNELTFKHVIKEMWILRLGFWSLQRLGTLIKLKDADPQNIFLGGLDSNGNDGKFAYIWQDDVMQVVTVLCLLLQGPPPSHFE